MEEFVLIRHDMLTLDMLEEIVSLKRQYWNYPRESQIKWISKNITDDDYHLLFCVDGAMIGYLNLVRLNIECSDKKLLAIGLGNVCVDKISRGQGFGKKIVLKAKEIIENFNVLGLLLCRYRLIDFYEKTGWRLFPCNNILVAGCVYTHSVMFVNNLMEQSQSLKIDRNF